MINCIIETKIRYDTLKLSTYQSLFIISHSTNAEANWKTLKSLPNLLYRFNATLHSYVTCSGVQSIMHYNPVQRKEIKPSQAPLYHWGSYVRFKNLT